MQSLCVYRLYERRTDEEAEQWLKPRQQSLRADAFGVFRI
jgi:hypothetical protein